MEIYVILSYIINSKAGENMYDHESPRNYFRDYLEFRFYARLIISVLTFLLLLIFSIYNFVIGRRDIVTVVSMILLVFVSIIIVSLNISKRISNAKKPQKYLQSTCYQVCQKPYKKDYDLHYYAYQIDVFEKLYKALSFPLYFDIILEKQVYDRGDISIDLVLFHTSGIYAIQALSYDGPLKGSMDDRIWKPHFYLGLKKTLKVDQTLYQTWVKNNLLTNPIMQTDLYVKNIKTYLPNYEIKGVSIFDESMIDDSLESMNQRLFSLNEFLRYVQEQPSIYSLNDLKTAQNILDKVIH